MFSDLQVRRLTEDADIQMSELTQGAKAIVILNVASIWGETPHYGQYQEMYNAHKERGLLIIAVPCN